MGSIFSKIWRETGGRIAAKKAFNRYRNKSERLGRLAKSESFIPDSEIHELVNLRARYLRLRWGEKMSAQEKSEAFSSLKQGFAHLSESAARMRVTKIVEGLGGL